MDAYLHSDGEAAAYGSAKPYLYGETHPVYTYLVGPEDSFLRYIHDHGIKKDDLFVKRLSTFSAAKALKPEDSVVFLKYWECLTDSKKIARHVASLRAVKLGAI